MARPKAASYDAQRGAIRDTAAQLFAEKGYASASIAEIAAACGVSKALLYHYYRDKEDLLFDVALCYVERLRALVAEVQHERLPAAAHLRRLISRFMDQLFPTAVEDERPGPLERRPIKVEEVEARLRALLPPSDAKRAHMERALQLIDQMAKSGWVLTIEESDSALPPPMLVVLIAWLAAMFVGFGMLAPRNTTVSVALLVGALSVSASIFLIEEMNHPLDGMIHISGTPLRNALKFLGH